MTVTVLYGDLRTGRITSALDATDAKWAQTLNAAGAVDQVMVPDDVIRALALRQTAPAAKTFLAVEIDDRIQEAGPIWSRSYSWEQGQLTLGATGLWGLFDHRKVIPVLAAGQTAAGVTTALTGADLGEIARALVAQAQTWVGGDLPLVMPAARSGTAVSETYPGYSLQTISDVLTQLTQQTAGPDITFRPQRNPNDHRFIQWVMLTGTAAAPQLCQVGADWVFDTTAPKSPVFGISTDEDATGMAMRVWETGNGTEAATLISTAYDGALVDAGWPLLEGEESRQTEALQANLDTYAADYLSRTARGVEVWQVTVAADAAREVQAGDYAKVKVKNNAWLGTGETRMRVKKKSGDLTDKVVLDMYQLQAAL